MAPRLFYNKTFKKLAALCNCHFLKINALHICFFNIHRIIGLKD